MSKKLNTYVTVHSDEGETRTFGPGEKLPKWAREKITNPNVWASDEDTADDATPAGDGDGGEGSSAGSGSKLVPPPLVGAGSGTVPWREYAVAAVKERDLNIEIPNDARKKDIISALEAAEIPTKG